MAVLVGLGLLPMLILSFVQSTELSASTPIPLVLDFPIFLRFLVVAPLLIAGIEQLRTMSAMALRHLAQSELIGEADRQRLGAAEQKAAMLRGSPFAYAAFIVMIGAGATFLRVNGVDPLGTWQLVDGADGAVRSWAGWWYLVVGLPLFQFVMLNWFWRYSLWCWLLWRISRLDLRLVPTHPDQAGGLGFLGALQRFLIPAVMAFEVMPAALFGQELLLLGTKLVDYQIAIISLVALGMVIVMAPPLVFLAKLHDARHEGLVEYSALSIEYMREFDRKWLRSRNEEETLLGSADIQSLADMANSFQAVRNMRVTPLDIKYTAVLVAPALASPYLPLPLLAMPLIEVVRALLGIVF